MPPPTAPPERGSRPGQTSKHRPADKLPIRSPRNDPARCLLSKVDGTRPDYRFMQVRRSPKSVVTFTISRGYIRAAGLLLRGLPSASLTPHTPLAGGGKEFGCVVARRCGAGYREGVDRSRGQFGPGAWARVFQGHQLCVDGKAPKHQVFVVEVHGARVAPRLRAVHPVADARRRFLSPPTSTRCVGVRLAPQQDRPQPPDAPSSPTGPCANHW